MARDDPIPSSEPAGHGGGGAGRPDDLGGAARARQSARARRGQDARGRRAARKAAGAEREPDGLAARGVGQEPEAGPGDGRRVGDPGEAGQFRTAEPDEPKAREPLDEPDEQDAPDAPGSAEFRRLDQTIREQRRAGGQNLSDQSRGIGSAYASTVGMGEFTAGTVYANTITIQTGTGQRTVIRKGPLTREWLDRRRRTFSPTTAYKELIARLPRCPVLILQGAGGSGRTTTAVLALERVAGEGDVSCPGTAVEVFHPDTEPGVFTEGVFSEGQVFTSGYGYLLDRSNAAQDELSLAVFSQLRELARVRGVFLVLLVDDRAALDLDSLGGYLVRQTPPDPHEVLAAHLRHRLGAEPDWPDKLRAEVEHELSAARSPSQAARLAAYLADAVKQELPGSEIVAGFRKRLLEVARTKLANPFEGEDVPGGRADALARRAHLLSCAVLNEMPLVTVFEAAGMLARRLHDVHARGTPVPRRVFGGTTADLLRYVEASDQPEGDAPNPKAQDLTRRVSMRHGLPAAVLEVAWRDYDAIHEPLLGWLKELAARSEDDAVRVRAAVAVGKLASYDFEYVSRTVIDPWAASLARSDRLAAASALEMAADDRRLDALVRDRVRQWCREPSHIRQSYNRQRTALLAFGTRIGERHVQDTLECLNLLAPRPEHGRDYTLALSLRAIFLAGFHEEARTTLSDWVEQGERLRLQPLLVQAARGLLALSQGTEESGEAASPGMLRLFLKDREWATRLWRLALTDPATSEAGWNVLLLWLRRASSDASLTDSLVDLVADLIGDERLRSRAEFRLRQWRTDQTVQHPVVEEILTRALRRAAGLANEEGSGRDG